MPQRVDDACQPTPRHRALRWQVFLARDTELAQAGGAHGTPPAPILWDKDCNGAWVGQLATPLDRLWRAPLATLHCM